MILVRADSRKHVGLGHLIRCLSLSRVLSREWPVVLVHDAGVSNQLLGDASSFCETVLAPETPATTSEIDCLAERLRTVALVVLDGYDFDIGYEQRLRQLGKKIVRVVDSDPIESAAEMLLSHSMSPRTSDDFRKYGLEYALVRPEFARKMRPNTMVLRRAFVCCGGLDAENSALKLAIELLAALPDCVIDVVGGAAYDMVGGVPDNIIMHRALGGSAMADLIARSDLALTSASTVAIEAASIGVPLLIMRTVDNQQALYEQLVDRGLAIGLGAADHLSDLGFREELACAIGNHAKLDELVRHQNMVLDGRAADRIAQLFRRLLNA